MGYPRGHVSRGTASAFEHGKRCGTPLADQELAEFRELERQSVLSSFYYHYARLIEALFAVERIERTLEEPDILGKHVRAYAGPNNYNGVGGAEAPRGTLIHNYKIDESGLITHANLIIATGHNNLAMNRGVLQVAKHFIKGTTIPEGMLNRVEAVIRCYDPCLSCSTHAMGQMALQIRLIDINGTIIDELRRN